MWQTLPAVRSVDVPVRRFGASIRECRAPTATRLPIPAKSALSRIAVHAACWGHFLPGASLRQRQSFAAGEHTLHWSAVAVQGKVWMVAANRRIALGRMRRVRHLRMCHVRLEFIDAPGSALEHKGQCHMAGIASRVHIALRHDAPDRCDGRIPDECARHGALHSHLCWHMVSPSDKQFEMACRPLRGAMPRAFWHRKSRMGCY